MGGIDGAAVASALGMVRPMDSTDHVIRAVCGCGSTGSSVSALHLRWGVLAAMLSQFRRSGIFGERPHPLFDRATGNEFSCPCLETVATAPNWRPFVAVNRALVCAFRI